MLANFFKTLDSDTVTLLTRFAMRAIKSGNANAFIKTRLQRLLDEDDAPKPEPPQRVEARVVRGR